MTKWYLNNAGEKSWAKTPPLVQKTESEVQIST